MERHGPAWSIWVSEIFSFFFSFSFSFPYLSSFLPVYPFYIFYNSNSIGVRLGGIKMDTNGRLHLGSSSYVTDIFLDAKNTKMNRASFAHLSNIDIQTTPHPQTLFSGPWGHLSPRFFPYLSGPSIPGTFDTCYFSTWSLSQSVFQHSFFSFFFFLIFYFYSIYFL